MGDRPVDSNSRGLQAVEDRNEELEARNVELSNQLLLLKSTKEGLERTNDMLMRRLYDAEDHVKGLLRRIEDIGILTNSAHLYAHECAQAQMLADKDAP
jgi:FtsZ-binding cell division protein ZapB